MFLRKEDAMQRPIWKTVFLFVAIAVLKREVLATPVITQINRFVITHIGPGGPSDSHSSSSPGPVDLRANVSLTVPVGDAGSDFVNANSSQQSTIDTFGFSYTSSLHLDGFSHGILGSCCSLAADADSVLTVTYNLDAPYAYQFTLTKVASPSGCCPGADFDSLPFPGPFPKSGVLQPGSYTFSVGGLQNINLFFSGQPSVTYTETASLQLTPVPEGDLPGYGLLLASAIGGVLWRAKSMRSCDDQSIKTS
jgi:hypothetical protein